MDYGSGLADLDGHKLVERNVRAVVVEYNIVFGQQTDKCNLLPLMMMMKTNWGKIVIVRSYLTDYCELMAVEAELARVVAEVHSDPKLVALIEANFSIAQSKRPAKIEQHFN